MLVRYELKFTRIQEISPIYACIKIRLISCIRRERRYMSKEAASAAVSTAVRLCEWRGVNDNG